MRQRTFYRYALFGLLLAVLAVFLIWPIVLTLRGGFVDAQGNFTLRYLFGEGVGVLREPGYLVGLRNSLMIGLVTTLLCLVIAMPLSVLGARYSFRGKTLMTSLILVPMILPPFVGAIGMRAMLGRFGAINTLLMRLGVLDPEGPGIDFLGGSIGGRELKFFSIVIMEALHLYPIVYLNVTAALANLDPALEEAARGLGAGRWRRFTRVTLPLILPGVFAGATICFIWSFTELGTPLMFEYYQVTPVQIYWGVQEIHGSPQPYALTVVMLVLAVGMYLLGRLALGGRGYAMSAKASTASGEQRLRGVRGWGALALFGAIFAVAVLPHIGVIVNSFTAPGTWYRSILPTQWTEHYSTALSHPLAMDSIANSLFLATAATGLCLIVGVAISYLVVRAKVRFGWVLDSLAMLPLAVPGLVMAFGYVAMSLAWPLGPETLTRDGLLQVVGSDPSPFTLLIIAYAIRRLPYIVRAASAGLTQTSGELEEAAYNLGATTAMTLRRIVVPLIMANLIAGAMLAFSFAMLEVSDSLILAQKEQHYPITKAIFDLFGRLGDGPYIASAMGVWGMALLTTTLVTASLLMGRRLGAIFRV